MKKEEEGEKEEEEEERGGAESRCRPHTFQEKKKKKTSKWISNLNVKCKTKKLEDKTGENVNELGYDNNFLYTIPKV